MVGQDIAKEVILSLLAYIWHNKINRIDKDFEEKKAEIKLLTLQVSNLEVEFGKNAVKIKSLEKNFDRNHK